LVTGASTGIGKAFAEVFAEHAWNLLLTARREDLLIEIAGDLETKYNIIVKILAMDLAEPDAPQRLFDAAQSQSFVVDAIVNNAGYGVKGDFMDHDWPSHRAQMELMVLAPLHLCHLFLPGMRERGYGRIINVSSMAGLTPGTAGSTLYGGIKSSLIQFSETLHMENIDAGVHVTALCPGFTWSEFHDVMETREAANQLPGFMWLNAKDVAEQGFAAVMRGHVVYVNGWVYKIAAVLLKVLPRSLALFLAGQFTSKSHDQESS
jgi:hypothetical protein